MRLLCGCPPGVMDPGSRGFKLPSLLLRGELICGRGKCDPVISKQLLGREHFRFRPSLVKSRRNSLVQSAPEL